MIELKNVSTERLMDYSRRLGRDNQMMANVYELLFAYDVSDYQKLKDMLNGNKEFEGVFQMLNNELFEVEERVRNANLLGLEPKVFTYDNYRDSGVDNKTLKMTDESNMGNVLLYTSPMERGGARINRLKYMSIDEIKHLSSHLSSYKLENAFASIRCFGIDTVRRVVDRVKFYEQQVLRQAAETQEREVNLFMLNKEAKTEIVTSELKDIIEYIVDNADECIWGKLTDTQKLRMMRTVLATRGEYVRLDRMALINAISNYTTLEELEQGVVKKRILDRFIIR